jgi:hypothetical protein
MRNDGNIFGGLAEHLDANPIGLREDGNASYLWVKIPRPSPITGATWNVA